MTIHHNDSDCSFHNIPYDTYNTSLFHVHLPPSHCTQFFKSPQFIGLTLILAVISVGTIVNNCLMVIAVALVRKLQTPCNMLILNLAVTDLLVGVFVIPFASIYQIMGIWIFSELMCDVFILFDVLLCTSSILNLCAISVDRYLVITKPFTYGVNRTRSMMLCMILIVWTASALISIPPLFGWRQQRKPFSCDYSEDLGYQIYATFIAFYVPLVIMLVLYGRIFLLASAMLSSEVKLRRTSVALLSISETNNYNQPDHQLNLTNQSTKTSKTKWKEKVFDWFKPISKSNQKREPKYSNGTGYEEEMSEMLRSSDIDRSSQSPINQPQIPSIKIDNTSLATINSDSNYSNNHLTHHTFYRKSVNLVTPGSRKSSFTPSQIGCGQQDNSMCNNSNRSSTTKSGKSKEVKAVRTLGIIMGCFVVCWLPFFLVQLFRPFLRLMGITIESHVGGIFFQIFVWMGYTNSFLNPLIYAKFNREFRQPFLQILQCHCRKINNRLRYQEYSNYATPAHYPSNSCGGNNGIQVASSRRQSTASYCSNIGGYAIPPPSPRHHNRSIRLMNNRTQPT